MVAASYTSNTDLLVGCLVSCAAGEVLLRGMLEQPELVADDTLWAHLEDFRAAENGLRDSAHPGAPHVRAAIDALQAAVRTFDAYRYSGDPEVHQWPTLRSNVLQLLDETEREAAAAAKELPSSQLDDRSKSRD